MNDGATVGILFALLGGLVACVGVPALFLVIFLKLRSARDEQAQTAAAVQSGAVTDLLPWGPGSLSELTREWVGASTYTSGVLGRNDRAGGRVPSGRSKSGWLLAFTMDAHHHGADGVVQAATSAHRLELRIAGGACQVLINGAVFGHLQLGEAGLFAPDGGPVGFYRRQPPVAQLGIRGRDVATLDTRTQSNAERAAQPTFLVTHLLAERTPDDEAWALVAAVLELAWFGPRATHDQLRRR